MKLYRTASNCADLRHWLLNALPLIHDRGVSNICVREGDTLNGNTCKLGEVSTGFAQDCSFCLKRGIPCLNVSDIRTGIFS